MSNDDNAAVAGKVTVESGVTLAIRHSVVCPLMSSVANHPDYTPQKYDTFSYLR